MYLLSYHGEFDHLPEPAVALYHADIQKLELLLQQGFCLNTPISIYSSINLLPLAIAAIRGHTSLIHWLIDHGANPHLAPVLTEIARHCTPDILRPLLQTCPLDTLYDHDKIRLFLDAYFGNQLDNFAVIDQAGIPASVFAGEAFRLAVYHQKFPHIQALLQCGADINYHAPCQVFYKAPTPVMLATYAQNMELVTFLVAHGADVSISDKNNMRPYLIASQQGNLDMAHYFQDLEPTHLHEEQNQSYALHSYHLPPALTAFLKQGPQTISFSPTSDVRSIRFYGYLDVLPMRWNRKKVLCLSMPTADFAHIQIVWYPAKKQVVAINTILDTWTPLANWKDFSSNMEFYLNISYMNKTTHLS